MQKARAERKITNTQISERRVVFKYNEHSHLQLFLPLLRSLSSTYLSCFRYLESLFSLCLRFSLPRNKQIFF